MSVTKDTTMTYQDMEKQQYEVLYKEMDVPLVDIRKKYFKPFMIVSLLLLLLTVLFASFVKIPNYLQVPIVIENTGQDHTAMFNHPLRVAKNYVKIGERVDKGQAICRITSPEIQSLISDIKTAEHNIKILRDYDSKNVEVQLKNIDSQTKIKNKKSNVLNEERSAAIALYHSRKKVLESELAYAEMMKDKNKALYKEGIISQFAYLDIEKKYNDKLNDLSVLEKEHSQILQQFEIRTQAVNEEVVTNSIKQIELESRYQLDESRLSDQIELAKQNLSLYYGDYQLDQQGLILLAPIAGKITYYYPDHQLLRAGEILYRLETGQGRFESKGYLKAKDVGYVNADMETKVMLETFPHYEWGSLSGRIKELSVSPNIAGQYPVAITLVGKNPKVTPLLQNGQTGTASIIIEKKSFFGYLFRDFKRVASEIAYND